MSKGSCRSHVSPGDFGDQHAYRVVSRGPSRPQKALGYHTEPILRRLQMTSFVLNCLARLHRDEKGQGLVEYLLILALVAFAATAGMGSLASGLNSAFSAIGSVL